MIRFRVFNASPADVAEERATLAEIVVPELRRILSALAVLGNGQEIELEAIRWETHSWPDVGQDAQDVINRQLTAFDIFVGIMWKRFGTPTSRAASGTGEEFERAYSLFKAHGKPKIMFYFRTEPFYPSSASEISQFQAVFEFKERLEQLGVRYWTYDSPLDFERFVREHLIRQVLDLSRSQLDATAPAPPAKERAPADHLVFISYTPENRDEAMRLAEELAAAGVRTWLDRNNLLPGQAWQKEIRKAIQSSSVFLVLLSSATASKTGYVQKEIQYALDEVSQMPDGTTYIIPVRLDDSEVPPNLAVFQWVDMFRDWSAGVESILRALKNIPASPGHSLPEETT